MVESCDTKIEDNNMVRMNNKIINATDTPSPNNNNAATTKTSNNAASRLQSSADVTLKDELQQPIATVQKPDAGTTTTTAKDEVKDSQVSSEGTASSKNDEATAGTTAATPIDPPTASASSQSQGPIKTASPTAPPHNFQGQNIGPYSDFLQRNQPPPYWNNMHGGVDPMSMYSNNMNTPPHFYPPPHPYYGYYPFQEYYPPLHHSLQGVPPNYYPPAPPSDGDLAKMKQKTKEHIFGSLTPSSNPNLLLDRDINRNDVLCGRGGKTNVHSGNITFRTLVNDYKDKYLSAKKKDKNAIAAELVDMIRSLDPPGRFLKKNLDYGYWQDIGDEKAKEKTSQALREGAPAFRKKMKTSNEKIGYGVGISKLDALSKADLSKLMVKGNVGDGDKEKTIETKEVSVQPPQETKDEIKAKPPQETKDEIKAKPPQKTEDEIKAKSAKTVEARVTRKHLKRKK